MKLVVTLHTATSVATTTTSVASTPTPTIVIQVRVSKYNSIATRVKLYFL